MKKRISSFIVVGMLVCACVLGSMDVNAKTLAQSFSGGSTYQYKGLNTPSYSIYQKNTYSQTKGYKGRHYVRAYIGGTRSSAKGAVADTGKKYSNGDIKCTASMKANIPRDPRTGGLLAIVKACFPTGYAKYGTK